jgi:hypothetical protein
VYASIAGPAVSPPGRDGYAHPCLFGRMRVRRFNRDRSRPLIRDEMSTADIEASVGSHHLAGPPAFSRQVPVAVTPNAVRHPIMPVEESQPDRWGGRRARAHQRLRSAVLGAVGGVGKHRHFRALGPFGARLFTPKLTPNDLSSIKRGHDFV